MKVFCHIVVPSVKQFRNCTLALESIRTGFPTADITIHWSPYPRLTAATKGMGDCVEEKAKEFGLASYFSRRQSPTFHADYLEAVIKSCANSFLNTNPDEPIVLLDGDIVFWKNCELLVNSTKLWKGFYVPAHLNEWSRCRSVSRIHSSFVCIKSPRALLKSLENNYPLAYNYYHGEYNGYKPFHPVTVFERARPTFFDSLAVAYQTIGAEIFDEDELDCFDHLNSSSFFDSMIDRLESANATSYAEIQDMATKDPTSIKGLWKKVRSYYDQRAALLEDKY